MQTYNDFMYDVKDNGEITIYKYTGECEEVTIPGSIDGHPVTEMAALIGNAGFCDSGQLKRVILPEGFKEITMLSFSGCKSLESVVIPASVTEISDSAFARCKSLKSIEVDENNATYTTIDGVLFSKDKTKLIIFPFGKSFQTGTTTDGEPIPVGKMETLSYTIPEGVSSIGSQAFEDCYLESVTFPDSVTEIDGNAFSGCQFLKDVVLPEGLETISWEIFEGCESLEEITIPENVTKIDSGAFKDCSALKSISIPAGVTEIRFDAFSGCSSLTIISIPEGVKEIEGRTFKDCKALTIVSIPASVEHIDISAFHGCEALEGIAVDDKNPQYCSVDGALFSKIENKRLFTPHALLSTRTRREITMDDLASMTDKEIISEISAELGLDYEAKPEIWAHGFCGDGPLFEVAFDGENVVQLGSIQMTMRALELCTGLKSLEVLNICYSEVDKFPDALCGLSKLKLLNLFGTKITELPESIGELSSLEELQFGGTQIATLPDTVCNLSQMKTLRAQHSSFSRFPDNIGKLTNLESIDFHGSQVQKLPKSLASCTKLRSLWGWGAYGSEDESRLPEGVTENIMANHGETSEMSPFTRLRIHCRNNEFAIQIVLENNKLVQIWNDYDRLLEIDDKSVTYYYGKYIDVDEEGKRYLCDESPGRSGYGPMYDDKKLSLGKLGTWIFFARHCPGCEDVTSAALENWIPQMYEFYCLDEDYKEDYSTFYEKCKKCIEK